MVPILVMIHGYCKSVQLRLKIILVLWMVRISSYLSSVIKSKEDIVVKWIELFLSFILGSSLGMYLIDRSGGSELKNKFQLSNALEQSSIYTTDSSFFLCGFTNGTLSLFPKKRSVPLLTISTITKQPIVSIHMPSYEVKQ